MGDRPVLSAEEDYYVNDTDTLAIPGQIEEDSPDYENIPGSSRSLSKPEPEPEIRPRGRKKKKEQSNQDRNHSNQDRNHSNPDRNHGNPDRNHSNPVINHGNPDPDQSQDVEDEGHYLALRNTVVESVTKDEAPKPPPDIPEKIIVTAPETKTGDVTPAEPEKVVLPSKKRKNKRSKCSRNKALCAVFSTLAVLVIAALLAVILWKFFYSSGAHCSAAPCQNGGTCVETGVDYVCVCSLRRYGRNCQICDSCPTLAETKAPTMAPNTPPTTGTTTTPTTVTTTTTPAPPPIMTTA